MRRDVLKLSQPRILVCVCVFVVVAGVPMDFVGFTAGFKVQRDPEVVFGQVFLGGLGVPKPTNRTFSGEEWLFGLAAEGGKANKPIFS